jgi:AraC-like DNA-binding protein
MERMSDSGTASFTSPVDYQAAIGGATSRGASVNFIVAGGGDFKARLTWLNLHGLRVLRGSANLPSIAYVSAPPDRVVVLFPTSAAPLVWGGLKLRFGDIVFHGRGERTHQWTPGEGKWGLVSMPPKQLFACGLALTGLKITAPPFHRVLRPPKSAASRLLRLHARVCRLAETRHELIDNPEVVRSLEQELLHAVVNCLTIDDISGNLKTLWHHAKIMVRFEEALAAHAAPQPYLSALCASLDVPERTLRVCCSEFLGVSPSRYLLLRRLNMARSALQHADPSKASVGQIARSYQFREPGRFAVTYRAVFGETPSVTLRRPPMNTP